MKTREVAREEVERLVEIALFKIPADLILKAGGLVNVFTGKVQEGVTVGISGKRVAYVAGRGQAVPTGPDTRIIDVSNSILCPGFIEGHTHVDGWASLPEFLKYAVKGGATTIVTETSTIAAAMGFEGVKTFIEETERQPVPVFITTPSEIPPFPEFETCAPFNDSDFLKILEHERCVGMGEVYWGPVIDGREDVIRKIAATLTAGKPVEGHAAGARREKLAAYRAAGISSCHESITIEEAEEKLALGMDVMIRCGYIRNDLKAIAPIFTRNVDTDGLMLVSDGYSPKMLVLNGYLNHIAHLAVSYGIDPVEVVKMLTIRIARHFHLEHRGGIAPGWLADIIAVENLHNFSVKTVISEGNVLRHDGNMEAVFPTAIFPKRFKNSISAPEVNEIDFYQCAETDPARVKVIVIKTETVTEIEETELELAENGNIMTDPSRDIIKLAVIYRGSSQFQGTIGFIKGFGLKEGAVATSLSWDCNNIVAVGPNECDMAAAVNRVRDLGGGMVICLGEESVIEVPLPWGGVTSGKPLAELACEINEFEKVLMDMGCPLPRPFLALQTLSFTGLPFYRLTDKGLLDIRARKLISVMP